VIYRSSISAPRYNNEKAKRRATRLGSLSMTDLVLETDRLTLRPVALDDLDAFTLLIADPEVVRYMGGRIITREELSKRIRVWRERFERDGFGIFALVRREDGRVLGRCGLLVWAVPSWETTTEAQVVGGYELELGGLLLGREYWGCGYATEAALAIRDYAFGQLGRDRLISLIAEANTAAAAVVKQLGMTIEGRTKLGDMEVDIWSLARQTSSAGTHST
jgi:RimJ/RimL family protein N-acetyltransferase